MKTFRGIGLGAVATVLSAGAWLGCSSDDTSTGTSADAGGADSTVTEGGSLSDTGTHDSAVVADAGSDTGTGTVDTGTPDTGVTPDAASGDASDSGVTTVDAADGQATGEAGDAGDSSAPDAAVLTCQAYCSLIQANCTGAYAQYATPDECLRACALTPVGTATDISGDTLGCRIYHAGAPAMAAPSPHCWHAGPYGFGGCGDECAAFCRLTVDYCSPAQGFDSGAPPYASLAACTSACPGFAKVIGVDGGGLVPDAGGYYAMGPAAGDTLDCREYHLGAALQSSANQQTHCPHPAVASATCHP